MDIVPDLQSIVTAADALGILHDNRIQAFYPSDNRLVLYAHARKDKYNRAVWSLCNILKYRPWAFLGGLPWLHPYICAYGLFTLNNRVHIEAQSNWPEDRTYLACHHRRGLYEVDQLLQFLPAMRYDVFKVITATPMPSLATGLFRMATRYLYADHNIRHLQSDDRYWYLVHEMGPRTAISVFPDRDGSTVAGDTNFWFRSGVFAASIYNQVPIIDVLVLEPMHDNDTLHIETVRWEPPAKNDEMTATNATEYAAWRKAHADLIESFRFRCQEDHKRRLKALEDRYHACDARETPQECSAGLDESYQKSLERNLRASKYFSGSTTEAEPDHI